MRQSEQINELAGALSKAQGALQGVKKSSDGQIGQVKTKYADLAAVLQAAQEPLSANGLAVTQPAEIDDGAVIVTTMLVHESGQWICSALSMVPSDEKGLSMAQVIGKIIAYLRRYGYMAMVGIATEDDDDGAGAKGTVTKRRPPQMVQAPAPPRVEPSERPYSPPSLQARTRAAVAAFRKDDYGDAKPTPNQLGRLRWGIGEALGSSGDRANQERHLLLEYLVGKASSTDLTQAENKALWKWLGIEQDSADKAVWTIDYEHARPEARAVVAQAMRDAGQADLLPEEGAFGADAGDLPDHLANGS